MTRPSATSTSGPVIDAAGVTFRLEDADRQVAGVRLAVDFGLAGDLTFAHEHGAWRRRITRPEVDRLEYRFELRRPDGSHESVTDPGNPIRARGAFGDKSVVQFADYREPDWLVGATVAGSLTPFFVAVTDLDEPLRGTLWSPVDLAPDRRAPLLLVHDGPEYGRLGSFTRYLAAGVASGELPAVRAALLDPGDRNVRYSADPAYTAALARELVPALDDLAPSSVRIGVGVSLGALAMLYLQITQPSVLDGMFLQSGSFFTPELDAQESDFAGFAAVTAFVAGVSAERLSQAGRRPVPTVLTCGGVEENRANNRAMAATLAGRGYPVELHERRDAHNFTAWRDALQPYLSGLIAGVVGDHAT